MSILRGLAVALHATLLSQPTAAQVAKLYPIDEAVQDPEFFAFRARLLVALQQKDMTYLYGTVKPNAGVDPFLCGVVVGRSVRVRQEPTATSAVLANLSCDVVRGTDWMPKPEPEDERPNSWVAVELADGRTGFIASEFVRSRKALSCGAMS